jgi:hypothetical protein
MAWHASNENDYRWEVYQYSAKLPREKNKYEASTLGAS